MNIQDITITSLETITAFGVNDGAYLFTLDELQNATLAQTQETTDITGKAGRKLSTLKRNKAVTVSGTNGMVSGGLMELQTGNTFENKATEVMWTDYVSVTSNASATTYKAVGTVGAEIEGLFVRGEDGVLGTALTQKGSSETLATGEFSYNPSTKAITLYTGQFADGTELVCFYKRRITADTLANTSDSYSSKCSLYIDALGEDKCANVYRIQFFVPKADFSGEFSLEMGDNQTVHAFEAEALSGACGAGGQLWTYTIFGVDAADAT